MDDGVSLSKREKAYLKAAKDISVLSDHRCKIGCVVVDQHRIVSSGHNSNSKKHSVQRDIDSKYFKCSCDGKLHAETMALLPYIKSHADLSHATLYTYRKDNNGHLAQSRPCPRCMQLIKSMGIRKIIYTTNDGVCKERLIY